MKKLFLILLFLVVYASLRAQVKVVLLRDTAAYNLSPAKLKQAYPPLFGKGSPFQGKEKMVFDTLNKFRRGNGLSNYLAKNEKQVGLKNFNLFLDEFVGANGHYEVVICSITAKTVSEQQEKAIVQLLAEYYQANPFPLKSPKGFHQFSGLSYGGGYAKRTVRKGPGIISSLEDARKTTRPDTVKILLLNQLELSMVPQEVYRFPKLEELDLSKNSIRHVPAELTDRIPTLLRLSLLQNSLSPDSIFMTRNKHLLALNIQGNGLRDIPKEVRKNRRLASLWVGNNPLKQELSSRSLRGLRHVRDLNLYNADLAELPRQIVRLKRLQILDLYYNNFTQLPNSIGRLKQLTQLAVSNNRLKKLPDALGRNKRLEVLYAHHNDLSELPETFRSLQSLRVLDIGYNWFSQFPELISELKNLEELDISNNNLTTLSTKLNQLTKLKTFHLRQNPLTKQRAGKPVDYATLIDQLEANKTEVFY